MHPALFKNEAKGVDHLLGTLHQKKQGFSSATIVVYFILALPVKREKKNKFQTCEYLYFMHVRDFVLWG